MDYTIRMATADDTDAIVRHRCEMMRELQETTPEVLRLMQQNFRPWLFERLRSGDYLGWLATTEEGEVVAGAGLIFLEWPPSMLHLTPSRRAYLLNVYTDPEHRKQGLAHRLTPCTSDLFKTNNIPVLSLHASRYGRPVYESLKFQDSSEMRLVLSK